MKLESQSVVNGSTSTESILRVISDWKPTVTTSTLTYQIISLLSQLTQQQKAGESGKLDTQPDWDSQFFEWARLSPPFMPASVDPLKIGTPVSPGSLLQWNTPMPKTTRMAEVAAEDEQQQLRQMRTFATGATRDAEDTKFDYEGFLSPLVVKRYAEYLHKHRIQADGQLRASDNWQKGIPRSAYIKSAWRHFMDWWSGHRSAETIRNEDFEDAICAVIFNASGYLFEHLKEQERKKF